MIERRDVALRMAVNGVNHLDRADGTPYCPAMAVSPRCSHSSSRGTMDRGLDRLRGAVVAIGNFDGVHRGHRAVIDAAINRARATHRPAAALTFEPHPRTSSSPMRRHSG